MTHDEFVGQVQSRARLGSGGSAEAAIRATLESLATRLQPEAAEHLAAQLPSEIGRHLRGAESFERLSLDEFFRQVQEREGCELPDSVYHARVVIEVLGEAVTQGAMEKLRAQLPDDFDRLFESGSQGRLAGERADRQGERPQ